MPISPGVRVFGRIVTGERGRASATRFRAQSRRPGLRLRIGTDRERRNERHLYCRLRDDAVRPPRRAAPDLAQAAILRALDDAGVTRDIQASYCANVFGGMILGQVILRDLEMGGPPIYNVENACASGATGCTLRGTRCSPGNTRRSWSSASSS